MFQDLKDLLERARKYLPTDLHGEIVEKVDAIKAKAEAGELTGKAEGGAPGGSQTQAP